jgi:hypothetical protein
MAQCSDWATKYETTPASLAEFSIAKQLDSKSCQFVMWATRARRSLKFCEMQVNLIASA